MMLMIIPSQVEVSRSAAEIKEYLIPVRSVILCAVVMKRKKTTDKPQIYEDVELSEQENIRDPAVVRKGWDRWLVVLKTNACSRRSRNNREVELSGQGKMPEIRRQRGDVRGGG